MSESENVKALRKRMNNIVLSREHYAGWQEVQERLRLGRELEEKIRTAIDHGYSPPPYVSDALLALDEQGEGGGAPGEFRTPESALGSPSPVSNFRQCGVSNQDGRCGLGEGHGGEHVFPPKREPADALDEKEPEAKQLKPDIPGDLFDDDRDCEWQQNVNSLIAAAAVALPVIRGARYVTTEQQEVMDALGDATEYFLPPESKTRAELLEEKAKPAFPDSPWNEALACDPSGTQRAIIVMLQWIGETIHAAVEAAKESTHE